MYMHILYVLYLLRMYVQYLVGLWDQLGRGSSGENRFYTEDMWYDTKA